MLFWGVSDAVLRTHGCRPNLLSVLALAPRFRGITAPPPSNLLLSINDIRVVLVLTLTGLNPDLSPDQASHLCCDM